MAPCRIPAARCFCGGSGGSLGIVLDVLALAFGILFLLSGSALRRPSGNRRIRISISCPMRNGPQPWRLRAWCEPS
jgi:hypothetical protein